MLSLKAKFAGLLGRWENVAWFELLHMVVILTFYCDPECLSYVDKLKLINDCLSFVFIVIINHPSIAFLMLFSILLLNIQFKPLPTSLTISNKSQIKIPACHLHGLDALVFKIRGIYRGE